MAVLRLPPILMHPQAQACRRELVQAMSASQDRVFLIDGADLAQFDSSALAVLLACQREALRLQGRVQVQALPQRLLALAHLYGVLDALPSAADPV